MATYRGVDDASSGEALGSTAGYVGSDEAAGYVLMGPGVWNLPAGEVGDGSAEGSVGYVGPG